MFSNRMRMTGFSGIDVADMVQQMMRAESFRLDRLRQQRDLNVWRQDMMRNIGTSIAQFQRRWTSVGVMGGRDIGNVNNWNANAATVTGVGNATGLTATAGTNAAQGTHTLQVSQLAQAQILRTAGGANLNLTNANTTERIDFASLLVREAPHGNFRDMTFRMNVNGITRDVNIGGDIIRNLVNSADGLPVGALDPSSTQGERLAVMLDNIDSWTAGIAAQRAALAANPPPDAAQTAIHEANIAAYENLINTERGIINNHFENILGTASAERTDFYNAINARLAAEFGHNTGTGLMNQRVRVEASPDGLSFIATAGNTASIQSPPAGGLSVQQLGLSSATLGFNVNQSLQDFLDGGSGSFTINDRLIEANFMDNTITVNGNIIVNRGANELRVQDMINAVNQSGAGVSLSFSALSGQFTMQHNQTGASNTINLDTGTTGAVTTGFLERIFNTDADGINGMVNSIGDDLVFQVAQNAEFLFNGAAATRETNNFMLNDITFNLAGIAMPDVGNANFNITVGRDTSNVRQMLVDFVEEYNALVRSLLDLTDVRRPRQEGDRGFFMPLTEEQRRGMSDREIEIWEEQARIGILHRDDTLRTIQQELTNVLFLNIRTEDGRTFNLGNAGIQLSPNTGEFGMLTINEDRLNFALEHHADALQQLFTATGGPLSSFSADPNAPAGQRSAIQQWGLEVGIADRLSHVFNRAISPSMGSITLRAGAVGTAFDNQNAMSRGIADQNRRIDNMLGWLQRREDSLFRQFSRMETAMMQAQSQMMFFEQLLWGGSGM